jgi:hypothetical protein
MNMFGGNKVLSEKMQQQIREYIDRLKYAARERRDDYAIETMTLVYYLFKDKITGVSDSAEEAYQYKGTIQKNANVVAALLDYYLLEHQETNDYFDSTLSILETYSKAYALYASGLGKYRGGIFERNTLDDMRASLEQLIINITNSHQTLENQISKLGTLLGDIGVKPHAKNMFTTLLSYYKNYQNDYIKHNDLVDPSEVSFIIEITSALMRYLIVALGNIKAEKAD